MISIRLSPASTLAAVVVVQSTPMTCNEALQKVPSLWTRQNTMAKILIIDDDEMMLGALSIFFRTDKHDVTTADDGPRGIELYAKIRPDVVLLDLSMPSMHGLAVLDKILEIDRQARVIVVTGYASQEIMDACKRKGAYAFYEKSMDVEALRRVVQKAVDSRKGNFHSN